MKDICCISQLHAAFDIFILWNKIKMQNLILSLSQLFNLHLAKEENNPFKDKYSCSRRKRGSQLKTLTKISIVLKILDS